MNKLGLLVAFCILALGCQHDQYVPPKLAPADFALILCRQVDPAEDDVQSATFILEPDGVLRAAIGPGCTLTTYPEPTTKLDRRAMQQVYELARDAGILRSDDGTALPDPPRLRAIATADGCQFHASQSLAISIRIRPPDQTDLMDPEQKAQTERWNALFNQLWRLSGLPQ